MLLGVPLSSDALLCMGVDTFTQCTLTKRQILYTKFAFCQLLHVDRFFNPRQNSFLILNIGVRFTKKPQTNKKTQTASTPCSGLLFFLMFEFIFSLHLMCAPPHHTHAQSLTHTHKVTQAELTRVKMCECVCVSVCGGGNVAPRSKMVA